MSESKYRRSRWWYGVAIPPVLSIVGWGGFRLIVSTIGFRQGVLGIVPFAGAVILSLVLSPLLAVSLYMDSRSIRDSEIEWDPNPLLWGGIGILLVVVVFFPSVTTSIPMYLVAIGYLFQRRRLAGPFFS